jgi:hypothetical protein
MTLFFLLQNWRTGGQNRFCVGGWYQLWGRMWGMGVGVQTWCKYCGHMYVNEKVGPVEMIPGMGEGG